MNKFNVTVKNPETNQETEVPIVQYVPTKGRAKGTTKLVPENMAKLKVQDFVNIWGEQSVLKVLIMPRFKQLLSVFTDEATHKDEDTLETDENIIQKDYTDMFSKLSLRGETIMALTRRLNEIIDEELPEALDRLDEVTENSPEEREVLQLCKALKNEQKELRTQIEGKKVKKDKPADGSTAPTPAVNEPATA